MIRKGYYIVVDVNYPKNPKLNGRYEGVVTQTGCYRSGFAFFKLDTEPKKAFPNSSRYVKVLEQREYYGRVV